MPSWVVGLAHAFHNSDKSDSDLGYNIEGGQKYNVSQPPPPPPPPPQKKGVNNEPTQTYLW